MINKLEDELANRSLTTSFKDFPDINELSGIDKASDRIIQAINKHERIMLVQDLDADGLFSYAIIYNFFKELNFTNYDYLKYQRSDGYGGFSDKTISQITDHTLVITMDTGITSNKWVNILNEKGIDTIILDHHIGSDLPKAHSIVNPNSGVCSFPNKSICGAQVTFFTLSIVNKKLNKPIKMNSYLDMVSIATIGDMMDTVSNRPIIYYGLKMLETTNKPFLQVLMYESFTKWRNPVTAIGVSFSIVALMNSSHRMTSSEVAISFINSTTYREANIYYDKLVILNKKRKVITEDIANSIVVDNSNKVLIYYSKDMLSGITGLIANQLVNKYNKPVLVLKLFEDDSLKGSMRSPEGIPLLKHLKGISAGHNLSGGVFNLTLQDIPLLQLRLNQTIDLSDITVNNDYFEELSVFDISRDIVNTLGKFEPTGVNNKMLTFKDTKNITDIKPIGKSGYIKLYFDYVEMLVFEKNLNLVIGQEVSFTYTVESVNKIMLVSLLL